MCSAKGGIEISNERHCLTQLSPTPLSLPCLVSFELSESQKRPRLPCQHLEGPPLGLRAQPLEEAAGGRQRGAHAQMVGAPALGLSMKSLTAECSASLGPRLHACDRAAAHCPSSSVTFRAAGGHLLTLPGLLPQAAIRGADKGGIFPSSGFIGPSNALHSRSWEREEAPVVSN